MLGFVANVLLVGLPHDWRLMLGAGAVVPALLLMVPEELREGTPRNDTRSVLIAHVS